MHVRIVGAGWAGLAAAVSACQRGWQVTLLEAGAHAGGRAKRITSADMRHPLDNGQHILIGAYQATRALLRTVGVDERRALHRLPLDLRDAQGLGLHLPNLPAPFNALLGIATTAGWTWADKICLLRAAYQWQRKQFTCPIDWTVLQLCEAHALTPTLRQSLIEPLCLSALNTDVHAASASVFLRVLQDSLLSGRGGADFLIPRQDLSTLLPDAALAWLEQHGAHIHLGHTLDGVGLQTLMQEASPTEPVVLATSFRQAAKLTQVIAPEWSAITQALQPRAIATVYLRVRDASYNGLQRPIVALRCDPAEALHTHPIHGPAQFVFCRQQLMGHAGVLAAVVSDCQVQREALAAQVVMQLQSQLGLKQMDVLQTVVDKQATFACTPQLQRPTQRIHPMLWACGDYVQGPYPATLEGAVRSGQQVIAQISQMREP